MYVTSRTSTCACKGIGVAGKEIPQTWQYAVVDNECPECPQPNLDLARSYDIGDGIWQIDW